MPPTSLTPLLAALLVVSLLAATVPATVVAAGESGGFGDNTITVTRGDSVEITVSHSDTAHVYIGSERNGFLLEAVLGGSGTHTITIDTYATTGAPSSFVSGASSVTMHTPALRRPLAATTYDMNVTVGGVEQDIGALTIEPRGEMSASTSIAPGSIFDADTFDLNTVVGAATPNETVAHGDAVVIPVTESGLENAFDSKDLDGDANAKGILVRLTELDPELNTDPETLVATEDPGLSVLTDFENDRFVVVWDTDQRAMSSSSNDSWRLDVVLTPSNGLVEESVTVASTQVQLVEPSVRTNDTQLREFYPWMAPTVSVTGRTNLAPGTTLNARAKSIDPPFIAQSDVTVSGNGTFETTVDVSRAASGQRVPVWILDHRATTERTVVRYDETAALSFPDQVSNGRIVAADTVRLDAGGFVVVDANGTRLGISDYLAPGTHEDVEIELNTTLETPTNLTAVAHVDRDLDRSFNASVDYTYNESSETDTEDSGESTAVGDSESSTDSDSETEPDATASGAVSDTGYVQLQGTGFTTTTTTTQGTTTMTTTPNLAASGPLVERTPIPAIAAADSGVSVPLPGWLTVLALLAGGVLAGRRGGDST